MRRQQLVEQNRQTWPVWTAALTLAISASLSPSANAADITVDAGGTCTLAEAITSANNDNAAGNGCVDGAGADTIILNTDVSLTAALPDVQSTITITGNSHTINGNNDATVGTVLYVYDSNLTVNSATITGGNGFGSGGGLYNYEGAVSLNNCTVTANNAGRDGGGIFNYSGTLTLTNSTVSGNTADANGGGISSYEGDVVLNESTVTGNSSSWGGGLYQYSGNLTVNLSTVRDNSADSWGGGVYSKAGSGNVTTVLSQSTVTGNSADSRAGGIYNDSYGGGTASLTLNNSTVSGNTTPGDGGGIYNYSEEGTASLTLNNSTVTGNSADTGGGGIYNYNSYYGTATVDLNTSLVSGNTAPAGNEIVIGSGSATGDDTNLFGNSSETGANAFVNFVSGATDINATSDGTTPTALAAILNTTLADNGGSTWTHALVAGSPALDLDETCLFNVDQRDSARPAGAGCDAGSFELDSSPTACGPGRNLPANTWLMTAPPCNPDPTGIVDQLGNDLPGVYGTNWISFTWDADAQDYGNAQAGGDALVPGVGNWHYSTSAGLMSLDGTETANVETCPGDMSPYVACFQIPLTVDGNGTTRWNLVGHPFPADVSWADVRILVAGTYYTPSAAEAAGFVSKSYYSWNGNAYQAYDDVTSGMIGTLHSQNSIWVRTLPGVDATAVSLWIPKP